MQTFLPFHSFTASASVLDYRRLGKQRVECKQLLSALGHEIVDGKLMPIPADRPGKAGWANHPAAKMWRGYERALAEYQRIMIMEWISRGYQNNMVMIGTDEIGNSYPDPPWLGDPSFHASHRSNLLRKDPVHYGQFDWDEPDTLEYVWPTI